MSELIFAVLLFGAVCFWAGTWFREWIAKRAIERIQQHLSDLAKEVESRVVEIVVQKEGERYFVYNKKTNEFMTQGATHQEITDNLNKRYPGMVFTADRDNLKEVGYNHESV